jgi:hypothetical protein
VTEVDAMTGSERKIHDAMTVRRPASLEDVAARTLEGELFDPLLREFLDVFYCGNVDAMASAIAAPPRGIDSIRDAYLGAVAEHLARRFGLAIPEWAEEPHRFLTKPFFAGGLENLKAILLVESPLAFRRRLIFVSANALSRPREPAVSSPR